ncbi:hypothetical protein AX17_004613 [Amanita inopinata Kibby_2008]|nr:hypothetical protein AX17_004613 [Amanita inopinata Kibby_2008]
MAQAATMGPPLSPREPRRSGRRSAPFSTTTSKSPDADPTPRQKDLPPRPPPAPSNSSRNKRPKQEDQDDCVDDRKNSNSNSTANGPSNGRSKRKTKERDKQVAIIDNVPDNSPAQTDDVQADPAEDEEQGITRCVCGSTEDDPDAGEFMVQCETCKVWQHGLCMGYQSEDQVHDDDYYCEQCRPELHTELLKKLARRPRHSTNSHAPASRVSRSHSPTHVRQPSKRRNTMNSRDAAFDESIKEIIEATAAEAAAAQETLSAASSANVNSHNDAEEELETAPSNRKKRKRAEDDTVPKKRTRSASTTSDHQGSIVARAETPVNGAQPKPVVTSSTTASKPSGRNKRGGRKPPALESANQEGEEGTGSSATAPSRRSGGGRAKGSSSAKRAPASSHGPGRSNSAEASRAYRNSHAYVVSQQPLFTSWGLPDYLAHLEEMLPTDTPQPLEVRAGPGAAGAGLVGRESVERTMERGVKVKWPSKRMSVGDMNKRVRALVEWVGREQANALDRTRRREALEKALKEESAATDQPHVLREPSVVSNPDSPMVVDGENHPLKASTQGAKQGVDASSTISHARGMDVSKSMETMKLMEELMEELISFQERFGPGAKSRDRERRTATAS